MTEVSQRARDREWNRAIEAAAQLSMIHDQRGDTARGIRKLKTPATRAAARVYTPAAEAGLRELLEQADYVLSVAVEETASDTLRTYLIREKARLAAVLKTSAPGGGSNG